MQEKPRLSMYWAASCGGCEISFVNIHEKLLDVDAAFDLVFCPCLVDTKKKDLKEMPDGSIAVTLFNGAIRTEENEEMAHLLRKKSALLIAFGSCAHEGCIPALGNLHARDDFFRSIYVDNPSVDNPESLVPEPESEVHEGILDIPAFYERARTLAQVTEVDYFVPGCPPEPHQIVSALEALAAFFGQFSTYATERKQILSIIDSLSKWGPLPPKGSVIGAGASSVCEECAREKSEKKIKRFYRTYEIEPDAEKCLLEQGLICMGIATRDGCGALCPKVNMPCTGCYGPPEEVRDQGAKMVAALGSIMDIGETKGTGEEELARRTEEMLDAVPDYAGTFYKYSLAHSILRGRRIETHHD